MLKYLNFSICGLRFPEDYGKLPIQLTYLHQEHILDNVSLGLLCNARERALRLNDQSDVSRRICIFWFFNLERNQ